MIAVPAVDLNAFIGDPHGHFAGIQFRHRRLRGRLHSLVLHPCRAMSQQARGVDLRCHVGEFELDRLKFGDRLSELLSLLGIMQSRFISALRHADAERGDADAAAVQNFQRVDEAAAGFAEQVVFRNSAVVENHR